MTFKLLALTFLIFTVGCQKNNTLKQKPVNTKYSQVMQAPQEQAPPPMVRNQPDLNSQEAQANKAGDTNGSS